MTKTRMISMEKTLNYQVFGNLANEWSQRGRREDVPETCLTWEQKYLANPDYDHADDEDISDDDGAVLRKRVWESTIQMTIDGIFPQALHILIRIS